MHGCELWMMSAWEPERLAPYMLCHLAFINVELGSRVLELLKVGSPSIGGFLPVWRLLATLAAVFVDPVDIAQKRA